MTVTTRPPLVVAGLLHVLGAVGFVPGNPGFAPHAEVWRPAASGSPASGLGPQTSPQQGEWHPLLRGPPAASAVAGSSQLDPAVVSGLASPAQAPLKATTVIDKWMQELPPGPSQATPTGGGGAATPHPRGIAERALALMRAGLEARKYDHVFALADGGSAGAGGIRAMATVTYQYDSDREGSTEYKVAEVGEIIAAPPAARTGAAGASLLRGITLWAAKNDRLTTLAKAGDEVREYYEELSITSDAGFKLVDYWSGRHVVLCELASLSSQPDGLQMVELEM